VWQPDHVTAAYGFDIEAELHDRLRGRPPQAALRWVEEQLGARVLDIKPLEGGRSSAVHLLAVQTPAGAQSYVVLRRYVLDWVINEPEIPINEALILGLLADVAGVPAPRLLAADPDGSATGTPTTVMSAVSGRVVWHPTDREHWLRGLAELLPAIHAVPLWPQLTDWAIYPPEPGAIPPPWTKYPKAWELAIELYEGRQPPSERVFVHRDYHPGNILWTGDTITGIVDWVSSCAGPPQEDVGHCRVNIAQHFGLAAADRFLTLWQGAAGVRDYDPYWDLTNVISMVGEEPDPAVDEFVAAAAARVR
jgi:aminoglycoside phosphotransferase (APT) family kinase protein